MPVSSEGVVSATYTFFFNRSFEEAVQFALWLHIGTVPSVLAVFRRDVLLLVKEIMEVRGRPSPSPLLAFLVVATLTSAPIGLALLFGLQELSKLIGSLVMAVVGFLTLGSGVTQLGRGNEEGKSRAEIGLMDAVAAGVAQGLAVLPGLSRSGMTIAVLLARRIHRREALALSFLMSVPASIGAALWVALNGSFNWSGEALVSATVAFFVGLVAIRIFLKVAERINLGPFVMLVGLVILIGGVWHAV